MTDPRLIDVRLDEDSILARNADIEQERRVAVFDLIERNHFAPLRATAAGHTGPYRLSLSVPDGRLAMAVSDERGEPLETHLLSLARFKRPIREYFAICDRYFNAVRASTAHEIETIDMARRGLHDHAAETLTDALAGKIEVDHDTARRLFTLVCVLHIRG